MNQEICEWPGKRKMNLQVAQKRICITLAFASSVIPSLMWVLNLAPPLLPGLVAAFSSLASLSILAVAFGNRVLFCTDATKTIFSFKRATYALATAPLIGICYGLTFNYCSVASPPGWESDPHTQIGFGMASWSLTGATREWVASQPDPPTIHQLMLERGGWEQGGVEKIWEPWTIYLSGTLLIILFTSSSLLWTFGWAAFILSLPSQTLLAPTSTSIAFVRSRFSTPPKIFISYRRSDSQDIAGRIYDRLTQHLNRDEVFKDVDSIRSGQVFPKVLEGILERCNVILVLIGDSWLDVLTPRGTRRLEDPEDFVRQEIESALRRNILVIPILLGKATMPEAKNLPISLQALVTRHALKIRPDPDFHRDMDRLVADLSLALPPG
jgi:TIR domain